MLQIAPGGDNIKLAYRMGHRVWAGLGSVEFRSHRMAALSELG